MVRLTTWLQLQLYLTGGFGLLLARVWRARSMKDREAVGVVHLSQMRVQAVSQEASHHHARVPRTTPTSTKATLCDSVSCVTAQHPRRPLPSAVGCALSSPLSLSQEYFSVRRREDVREAVAGTRKPGNHFVVEHETGACSEKA